MTGILFPPMSSDENAEGLLATWFVSDGETVAADQLIGEVQVDKVAAEVFAPQGGTIRLMVDEDQAVQPGDLIARLE